MSEDFLVLFWKDKMVPLQLVVKRKHPFPLTGSFPEADSFAGRLPVSRRPDGLESRVGRGEAGRAGPDSARAELSSVAVAG